MGFSKKHSSTAHIIKLSLNCCIGSFYFGYNMGTFNLMLDFLDNANKNESCVD